MLCTAALVRGSNRGSDDAKSAWQERSSAGGATGDSARQTDGPASLRARQTEGPATVIRARTNGFFVAAVCGVAHQRRRVLKAPYELPPIDGQSQGKAAGGASGPLHQWRSAPILAELFTRSAPILAELFTQCSSFFARPDFRASEQFGPSPGGDYVSIRPPPKPAVKRSICRVWPGLKLALVKRMCIRRAPRRPAASRKPPPQLSAAARFG